MRMPFKTGLISTALVISLGMFAQAATQTVATTQQACIQVCVMDLPTLISDNLPPVSDQQMQVSEL